MIQLRECALLDRKPFALRWRKPCVAQNFDRDLIFQILAFCKIHNSHSAMTGGSLVVQTQEDYDKWLATKTPGGAQSLE